MIGNSCGKCPDDSIYVSQTKSCKPRCGVNEFWQINHCECAAGYYFIGGSCRQCPGDQVYEPSLQNCRAKCVGGQIWANGQCQCLVGSYFVNGSCQLCPVEKKYDPVSQTCEKICKKQNEYYNNGVCSCLKGYARDQLGNCSPKQCPPNSYYNSGTDACVCNTGYFIKKSTGQCVQIPNCPANSKLVDEVCVCNSGFNWNNDKTVCIQCNAA